MEVSTLGSGMFVSKVGSKMVGSMLGSGEVARVGCVVAGVLFPLPQAAREKLNKSAIARINVLFIFMPPESLDSLLLLHQNHNLARSKNTTNEAFLHFCINNDKIFKIS